ncbi:myoglobin [Acipenser oxyrinchus oxyrinchus]|uniref:Myoglobin n=1 Tax=Acipenser oxyrinchus oxyrinchus TaxID=40147 RepID=A0AAD8CR12_ACIOX|nr:myoglobin [Acipenser oxyrinchus oxyrinchus]
MALSDAEWSLVLKAWGPVESDVAGHGQAVLLRLFKDHPETLQLFPKFKSLQPGELASSADIKAHGNTVISKLGDLLKQKGGHAALLRPLGESHAKKHKIPLANFKLICDVIVTVLKEKYSDFGPDSQAAMSKALDLIFGGMGPLYQEFGFAG